MTRKIISLLLISIMFVLAGCSSGTDRPYDSSFGSAKEWAEYWCGPCEQTDMRKEDRGDGDYYDYAEYYTMRDLQYGFTYTVNALYRKYGSSLNKPSANYSCADFDEPYMKEFIKTADLSPVADKYQLTTDINATGEVYYVPMLEFETDLELTDEQANEILTFSYEKLEEFDQRRHFTKNENSSAVKVCLFYAPTEEQKASGIPHNSKSRTYGYTASKD